MIDKQDAIRCMRVRDPPLFPMMAGRLTRLRRNIKNCHAVIIIAFQKSDVV